MSDLSIGFKDELNFCFVLNESWWALKYGIGQEAMGTNLNMGGSLWTGGSLGSTSLLCGWLSADTGCPERLWDLLLGDLQKPPGNGPGQPALGGPAGVGVGADDLQGCLLNSAILWCRDPVKYPFGHFSSLYTSSINCCLFYLWEIAQDKLVQNIILHQYNFK